MKTKNIFTYGFTLIEVIVVIAIIAILSTVVLSASSSARIKANDVSIKANLDSIRTSAEFFRDKHGHYGAIVPLSDCASGELFVYGPIASAIKSAEQSSNSVAGTCLAEDSSGQSLHSTSWAVSVPLASDNSVNWCVDSNGYANVGVATIQLGQNIARCL